jgi:predicted site-specific integrase-resolvase
MPDVDRVYSIKQAGEALSLSRVTMWRLMKGGKLGYLKLTTRRRGIRASELRRFQDAAAA